MEQHRRQREERLVKDAESAAELLTPMAKFKNLARALLAVPNDAAKKEEQRYKKEKTKRQKRIQR